MRALIVVISLIITVAGIALTSAVVRADVKALFDPDMSKMDFAEVMVAVERIINPRMDGDVMLAKIERMAIGRPLSTLHARTPGMGTPRFTGIYAPNSINPMTNHSLSPFRGKLGDGF